MFVRGILRLTLGITQGILVNAEVIRGIMRLFKAHGDS